MTNIDEIEARLKAATPGPWESHQCIGDRRADELYGADGTYFAGLIHQRNKADVVFIAAVGVVWRVVLKLVVEPVRRLGSRAREAGERQRDRVVRGGR